MRIRYLAAALPLAIVLSALALFSADSDSPRERTSINDDWRFAKGDPPEAAARLAYDSIRQWVLPTGNAFIKEEARRYVQPQAGIESLTS